ncbi:MAG: DUF4193 family protein [Actinomycetota bacterium]
MEDTDEQLDDEELEEADEDAPEAADGDTPTPPATAARAKGAAVSDEDVESIDQIAKKEARAGTDEEEVTGLALTREEKLEPLAVKVVPPQDTEFVCKKCYLVKHRSQLKDAKRQLCRDCA